MKNKLIKFLKDRVDLLVFNGLITVVISLFFNLVDQLLSSVNLLLTLMISFIVGNLLFFIAGVYTNKKSKRDIDSRS